MPNTEGVWPSEFIGKLPVLSSVQTLLSVGQLLLTETQTDSLA